MSGATIEVMKPTLEDGLRALREAAELAPHIKIELTDDYLALIAQVEAMPQNAPGADKSGRWRGSRAYWKAVYSNARLLPRKP
jgi:hypothetical protein